jgi:hypothetical protein
LRLTWGCSIRIRIGIALKPPTSCDCNVVSYPTPPGSKFEETHSTIQKNIFLRWISSCCYSSTHAKKHIYIMIYIYNDIYIMIYIYNIYIYIIIYIYLHILYIYIHIINNISYIYTVYTQLTFPSPFPQLSCWDLRARILIGQDHLETTATRCWNAMEIGEVNIGDLINMFFV